MNETSEAKGREGEIMRVLPHGTVMIWDPAARRAYPFYKAGHEVFRAKEAVRFVTDPTDTFVVSVTRPSGSGRRKPKHDYLTEEVALRRTG